MLISDILHAQGHDVLTTTPEAFVCDVAHIMTESRVGGAVVLSSRGVVRGVVSERDIVRACAHWPTAVPELRIGHIFTRNPQTCKPDAHARDALELMTEGRFRHLPVMSDGNLQGLISLNDLYRALLDGRDMAAQEKIWGRL